MIIYMLIGHNLEKGVYMNKSHQIIFISICIGIFVLLALVVYFSEGVGMRTSRYYRLDTGVAVEFLTDSDNIVDTIYPVDELSRVLVSGENFVGMHIDNAVEAYLDLCARMGYIDVDSRNNGVQISVSSTFTQAIENEVYEVCNKYFLENEIFCIVAESDADLALFKEKKEKNISSIEKLVLIKSVLEKTDKYTIEELAKMNESELMKILEGFHEEYANNMADYSDDDYVAKMSILANNKQRYDDHITAITNGTRRDFTDKYSKYKKSETYDWELDFTKKLAEKKS